MEKKWTRTYKLYRLHRFTSVEVAGNSVRMLFVSWHSHGNESLNTSPRVSWASQNGRLVSLPPTRYYNKAILSPFRFIVCFSFSFFLVFRSTLSLSHSPNSRWKLNKLIRRKIGFLKLSPSFRLCFSFHGWGEVFEIFFFCSLSLSILAFLRAGGGKPSSTYFTSMSSQHPNSIR